MYIPLTYSTIFICSSSIYYCIININIHQCIINNNKHIHTMHNTPIFTWKPNVGENHIMFFLYVKNYIQGSTKFQFSAPTGRRLQPPSFLGSNLKEAPTPWVLQLQSEGGYNHLVLRLQPEGSSNSLILQHQPEGGYNPLSFPHPALKYKCQITDETTATLSL
jgi:hypothetical protein